MNPSVILNNHQYQLKIKRIASEIYEHHFKCKKLILVGIKQRGYEFAQHLQKELASIGAQEVVLIGLALNKDKPIGGPVKWFDMPKTLKGETVILVDDVLNTGSTLMGAIKAVLEYEINELRTSVLVDRKHRLYPVRCDYVGLTLSTTFQEHISVQFKGATAEVTLN